MYLKGIHMPSGLCMCNCIDSEHTVSYKSLSGKTLDSSKEHYFCLSCIFLLFLLCSGRVNEMNMSNSAYLPFSKPSAMLVTCLFLPRKIIEHLLYALEETRSSDIIPPSKELKKYRRNCDTGIRTTTTLYIRKG